MKHSIQDIATSIQVGYQPREAVTPDPAGSHVLIQMRNLLPDGTLDVPGLTRFNPERDPEPYRVCEGDVLLQVRGTSHLAGVVSGLSDTSLASNHFYILRVDATRVLPDYLVWYIRQPRAQQHLHKGAQGTSNVTVLTRSVFESLEVPLPSLEVQRQIVALDRLQWRERLLTEKLNEKRAQWLSRVSLKLADGNLYEKKDAVS